MTRRFQRCYISFLDDINYIAPCYVSPTQPISPLFRSIMNCITNCTSSIAFDRVPYLPFSSPSPSFLLPFSFYLLLIPSQPFLLFSQSRECDTPLPYEIRSRPVIFRKFIYFHKTRETDFDKRLNPSVLSFIAI